MKWEEFVQKWDLNRQWNFAIHIFTDIIKPRILHSKKAFLLFFSAIRGTIYSYF